MPKKKNRTVRELAKIANTARNKQLTAEQRSAIARKAGQARWKGLTAKERSALAARGGAASAGTPKSKPKRRTP
jgi:hypothetical protein